MFGFFKPKFRLPDFGLRTVPGPGAGNAAFMPGNENPLFSPTGAGIVTTYPWQLTGRGDYFIKRLVVAGQVQGYQTGAFGTGDPLANNPAGGGGAESLPGAAVRDGATG